MNEKSVVQLMHHVYDLQQQVTEAEEGNCPIYCPTCSSCGEEGCCSPDVCEAVKCLHEKSNLRSYYEAQMENSILWKFLEMCKAIQEERTVTGDEINTWAKQTETMIYEIWKKEYGDLEKFFSKSTLKVND